LGKTLLVMGYTPLYFTNGSPVDEVILASIKNDFVGVVKVIFADRPMVPEDLVKTIVRCEKIIAYRLHACIVATSLGVPAIGLAWDKKLSSYFESIGAADRVCIQFNADTVAKKLAKLQPLDIVFTKEPYLKLIR
jgi:polysaccharide pyruvyl transferase WcaK-like protein